MALRLRCCGGRRGRGVRTPWHQLRRWSVISAVALSCSRLCERTRPANARVRALGNGLRSFSKRCPCRRDPRGHACDFRIPAFLACALACST
eukprot:5815700-Alexandrium_andersonii.AAC.1